MAAVPCICSQLTVQIAGLCDDAQVAETWSTSDMALGTTEATGSDVSAAAATSNKALLQAQKQLRISQQQVWHTMSHISHAFQLCRQVMHPTCRLQK